MEFGNQPWSAVHGLGVILASVTRRSLVAAGSSRRGCGCGRRRM